MIVPYYLEVLVLNRLRQKVDSSLMVMRAANIETMPRQFSHALYVIPSDLEINAQKRYQVALRESVNVVVVVRNAASQLTGEDSRFEAGPILATVIQSLLGWEPSDGYEQMQMISAPPPEFEAGFGYYPLAFSTRYTLTGDSR